METPTAVLFTRIHNLTNPAEVVAINTGFDYDSPADPPQTKAPDAATLAILRGRVTQELAETYLQFAEILRSELAAA